MFELLVVRSCKEHMPYNVYIKIILDYVLMKFQMFKARFNIHHCLFYIYIGREARYSPNIHAMNQHTCTFDSHNYIKGR